MPVFFYAFFCLVFWMAPLGASPVSLDADRFEFYAKDQKVVAKGRVQILKGDITLKSKGATYFKKEDLLVLEQDVVLTRKDMTLTCLRLVADGKQNLIVARDRVTYGLGTIKGNSDQADYFLLPQRVVLSGTPVVYQGENLVRGDSIVVDIRSKKVVTKGRSKLLFSPDKL